MNFPQFQRVQLNIFLENESQIRNAERKYKVKKIRQKEGKYPEIEKCSSQWIRETIRGGVSMET